MKEARLFNGNNCHVVSAEEVKTGLYDRNSEFVDLEYEFKVKFVRAAKNNGAPYFRLYYSREEYRKKFPDSADRYEIIANIRHYKESPWHKTWKKKFEDFCKIEKRIKNDATNRYKVADAYYEKTQTCVEFQHSYIDFYFEERNKFYSNLSINIIWLYDLSTANTNIDEYGNIEILEDNSKGFFKISENPENLKDNYVYIQVRSGKIYRVRELLRRESSKEFKSTIRYFNTSEVYTEDEFIEAIRLDSIKSNSQKPTSIMNLWNSNLTWMIVENVDVNSKIYMQKIYLNSDGKGGIFRNYNGCIRYRFYNHGTDSKYTISLDDEEKNIWVRIADSQSKKGGD